MSKKAKKWERTHEPGHVMQCPECGKRTFAWSDRLREPIATPGRLVLVTGLTGHVCRNCGARGLDMASALEVEAEREAAVPANYEVAVTRQRDRRAVFFPKDLVRIMDADEADKARLTPIDRNRMLIELVRDEVEESAS